MFYCLTPVWKKQRLEFANCSICCAFLRGAALGQQLYFFRSGMERQFFFLNKDKKNSRDLFCPVERVWCLLLMLGLLHQAAVQISLLSRKYGFLSRRHPRLRTFQWSWSQSCLLGGKKARDSDSAGPLQGCAALNAALVRPARISLPPAAFTRLLSRPLGFTYLQGPRVHASGIGGSSSALRKERCCLFCESIAPEGSTVPKGTVWFVELNGYQSIFSLALIFFLYRLQDFLCKYAFQVRAVFWLAKAKLKMNFPFKSVGVDGIMLHTEDQNSLPMKKTKSLQY